MGNVDPPAFLLDSGLAEVVSVVADDPNPLRQQQLQLLFRMVPVGPVEGRGAVVVVGKGVRASSSFYVGYGRMEVDVRMAAGSGAVTSVITMSDDRDEIDFEWVGKNTHSVQTNYYYQGE